MEHHVITRLDECGFIVDRTIRQALMTQQPAALISFAAADRRQGDAGEGGGLRR